MRPGPLFSDYPDLIGRGLVSVIEEGGSLAGLIVLVEMPDHLQVENVAVDPDRQGEGLGRALLAFAEESAAAAGLDELRLFTHSKMTENRALYRRLGYLETERRDEQGFGRVFFVKSLGRG